MTRHANLFDISVKYIDNLFSNKHTYYLPRNLLSQTNTGQILNYT